MSLAALLHSPGSTTTTFTLLGTSFTSEADGVEDGAFDTVTLPEELGMVVAVELAVAPTVRLPLTDADTEGVLDDEAVADLVLDEVGVGVPDFEEERVAVAVLVAVCVPVPLAVELAVVVGEPVLDLVLLGDPVLDAVDECVGVCVLEGELEPEADDEPLPVEVGCEEETELVVTLRVVCE